MGKLVRDRIPAIIAATGRTPDVRVLGEAEYLPALRDKLVEEAEEARACEPSQLVEELADVYEVLAATAAALGVTWADVTATAERKRAERGGFADRLFLQSW